MVSTALRLVPQENSGTRSGPDRLAPLSGGAVSEPRCTKETAPLPRQRVESNGSAGRTRTYNPPVTVGPVFSYGSGISLHPERVRQLRHGRAEGVGRF